MELGLTGKVVIVTGASKGIGRAIAEGFGAEGCRVAICARGEEDLQATKEAIERAGGEAMAAMVDATKAAEIDDFVQRTLRKFGSVDVLVNNVGGIGRFAAFEDLADGEWEELFALNVLSVVRFTRAVLPTMKAQQWGRIINISSESGTQPDPMMPHYNATKGALNTLTKSLSKAYGEYGILVNIVSPAFVKTPLVEGMIHDEAKRRGVGVEEAEAAMLREFRPNIVVGRAGASADVVPITLLLASDLASFMTGGNYRVDGGSVASI